ncbi:MAG: hypothetical protein KDC39_03390 [Actinobacteria bacterium]|nr:hypothetical protein [Actinomycetota bacterium]
MQNTSIAVTLLIVAGVVLGGLFGLIGLVVGAAAGLVTASVYAVVTQQSPRTDQSE